MQCSKCHTEFEGNFCPNCGAPVQQTLRAERSTFCTNCGNATQKKICTHCGVKNHTVHNYCSWCGTKLDPHATICPGCQEPIKRNRLWRILAAIWIVINAFMVIGFAVIDYNPFGGLLFVFPLIIALPFVGKYIQKVTHSQPNRKARRFFLNVARVVFAILLFFSADFLAIRIDAPHPTTPSALSAYTYDEYVMYSTITKGYEKTLDSLKNPKTAEFLGIGYNSDSEMVYFCVIAENDFGANTKCYISYSKKYDKLEESDDLKYYYDTAEIKRTMDDLAAFMEAVKNADESDVPTQGKNEALDAYSDADRKMFEIMIAGIDDLNVYYDDLVIVGYMYSSEHEAALFYFTGEDASGEMVMTYAKYSDGLGLMISDAYKDMYGKADTVIFQTDIEKYEEATKKDISK